MKTNYFVLLAILLCIFEAAIADTHFSHPSSTIELGKPYDSFRPEVDLRGNGYFVWENSSVAQEEGLQDLTFQFREVETIEELFESLNIDLNAEARSGLTSGKISSNFDRQVQSSERDLLVVLTASRLYKPKIQSGSLRLSESASSRLEQAAEDDRVFLWRQVAGSEVVTSTTSGASVSITYQFTTASAEQKERLSTALSAEWAAGNAQSNMLSIAQRIDSTYTVNIAFNQIGGNEDTSALEALVRADPGNVSAIRDAMAASLNNVSAATAKIIFFNTTPINAIDDVVFSAGEDLDVVTSHFAEVLRARRIHFQRLTELGTLLESSVHLSRKPLNSFVDGGQQKLGEFISELEALRNQVLEEARQNSRSMNPSKVEVQISNNFELPRLIASEYFVQPYVNLASWDRENPPRAIRCGTTPHDCENHDFYQEYWPVLDVALPELTRSVQLFKNCQPVALLNKTDILEIQNADGSIRHIYNSGHAKLTVYTWGANNMAAERNRAQSEFEGVESGQNYFLKLEDNEGFFHYLNIGNFTQAKNSIIDVNEHCPT